MPAPSQTHDPWPFVARDIELANLASWMTEPVAADAARSLVIGGAAGVGKTRLVRAAASKVSDSVLVETVLGSRASADLPYAALARIAPGVAAGSQPDVSSLMAAAENDIRIRAAGRPMVLAVDDAQHLDLASASLLLHLVLTGTVRVVATVRSGEPVPEPVSALWKEGTGRRIDLAPVSQHQVRSLLSAVLEGDVADRTVSLLHGASGGNLLFLRELVLAALESGTLRVADGAWRWTGAMMATPRLIDAVAVRLEALSAEQRYALATVAVAEPLPPAVAERLTEPQHLVRLEGVGLIEVTDDDGGPWCRLAHPLHGEAILGRMGTFERRSLLRRLADAYEDQGHLSADDRLRVVSWRLQGGGETTPEDLIEAAALANQRFAPDEAERLGRAALDRGGDARAALEVAAALLARNAFDDAEEVLAEAEGSLMSSSDPRVRQLYLHRRFVALFYGLDRPEAAAAAVDRFERSVSDQRALQVVPGIRAHLAVEAGRLEEALTWSRPVADDTDALALALYLALAPMVEALTLSGQTLEARRWGNVLRTLAETGDPEVAAAGPIADLAAIQRSFLDGRPGDLGAYLERIHADLHASVDNATRGMVALSLGATHLLAGAPVSARRRLLDACAALRRTDGGRMLPWALALLARAEALMGAVDRARVTRDEAVDLAGGTIPARQALDFASADVFIDVAAGQVEIGCRRALRAADQLPELRVHRAMLLHLAMRLGADPAPLAPLLTDLAADVESALPALLRDHAVAWRDRDASGLLAVADAFESSGAGLLAAEVLVHAARATADADGSGSGSGADLDASVIEARARDLAARLEGARTPLLASLSDAPASAAAEVGVLSERERAVLEHVIAG